MDDPEYEVSDVSAQPLRSGTVLSRHWRLVVAACSTLLALIVIVSAWLPLHDQPHRSTSITIVSTVSTRVLAPTPLPITSALGAPPTNCPSASSPTTITVPAFDGFSGSTVQLNGGAPVWIPTPYMPQSITDLASPTPPSSSAPEWPGIKIIWEVGPTSHPTASVEVKDVRTGTLAWWAEGGSSPQVPILQLAPPPDGPTPGQGYLGYITVLFITQAGCYDMTVTWLGGSWSYIFAAGWEPA